MSTEFVGSKQKSQTGRGGMQDQSPSSVYDKTLPPIPNVSTPNAVVPGLDVQDTLAHRVSGTPTPHMNNEHPRTSDTGSPGGKVPTNNRPVTKAATPGTFKRD